jgi:hypothetical protein
LTGEGSFGASDDGYGEHGSDLNQRKSSPSLAPKWLRLRTSEKLTLRTKQSFEVI